MLNIKISRDQYDHQTHQVIHNDDNAIVVLTYDGKLFFHKIINSYDIGHVNPDGRISTMLPISYTCELDMDYMMNKFQFGRVLNIRRIESSSVIIIIETEDHSLFQMDIRSLFLTICNGYIPIIVHRIIGEETTMLADFREDEKLEWLGVNMNVEITNLEEKSIYDVKQIIPKEYFNDDDENDDENDDITGYRAFMKFTSGRNFVSEEGLSFEQKINNHSPRVFTAMKLYNGSTFVLYYDNNITSMKNNNRVNDNTDKLFMVYVEQTLNEDHTFHYTIYEEDLSSHRKDSLLPSSSQVIKLNINKYKDEHLFSVNGVKTRYGKIDLEMICNSNNRKNNNRKNSNSKVEERYVVTLFHGVESLSSTLHNITKDDIIKCVKNSVVSKRHIPEDKFSIYEDFSGNYYVIKKDGRLLAYSPTNIVNPGIKLVDENVAQILNYSSELHKDVDLLVKINKNNTICVPYEHYLKCDESDIITKQLLGKENILFRIRNSPYNFKVQK